MTTGDIYSARLLHLGPHTTIADSVLQQLIGSPVKNKVGGRDGVVKEAWTTAEWVYVAIEEV